MVFGGPVTGGNECSGLLLETLLSDNTWVSTTLYRSKPVQTIERVHLSKLFGSAKERGVQEVCSNEASVCYRKRPASDHNGCIKIHKDNWTLLKPVLLFRYF